MQIKPMQFLSIFCFCAVSVPLFAKQIDKIADTSAGALLGKSRRIPWLVNVETFYSRQQFGDTIRVKGMGTLVKNIDRNKTEMCFVMTAAHLIAGHRLQMITQDGQNLSPNGFISDSLTDIAFINVNCPKSSEIPVRRGSAFEVDNSNYFSLKNTDALQLFVGDGVMTPITTELVEKVDRFAKTAKERRDFAGGLFWNEFDFVVRSRLRPGLSGGPLIWYIKERFRPTDSIISIGGVAKSINKFLKETYYASLNTGMDCFIKYLHGDRGETSGAHWVFEGELIRVSDLGIREADTYTQPTGDFERGPIGNSTSVELFKNLLAGVNIQNKSVIGYRAVGSSIWKYAEFEKIQRALVKKTPLEFLEKTQFSLSKQFKNVLSKLDDEDTNPSTAPCLVVQQNKKGNLVKFRFKVTDEKEDAFMFHLNDMGGLGDKTFEPIIQVEGESGTVVYVELKNLAFSTQLDNIYLIVQPLHGSSQQTQLRCQIQSGEVISQSDKPTK